nr:hypothetical protein [Tanacetum cinerariifolium]
GEIAELDADEDVTSEKVNAEVSKDADVQRRLEESQAKVYHLDLEHADKVLSMQETDEAEPAEVKEVIEVVTVAKLMTEVVTTPTTPITAALVPKAKVKSKDKDKGILVEEPKPLRRQAQIEQDEAFARELEAELNVNINWNDVIDQVKRKERQDNTVMRYQALKRKPITKAQARKNMMAFLEKGEKEIEEEESKRKSENLEQKAAKKQKIDEEKAAKKQKIDEEVEELKTHLQIVPNDENDLYTEATPVALKVPVVDYQIHHEHNKPFYKIIKADGTHQMILLVETKYPLTRFTLEQMLNNVRLEVEEESEMSLELLRLMRRQQQEGYKPE